MTHMALMAAVVEALVAAAAFTAAGCVAARSRRSPIVSALLWVAVVTAAGAALFTWFAIARLLADALLYVASLVLCAVGPWWLLGAGAVAAAVSAALLIRRYA